MGASDHKPPIVSHVLYVADQRHPWKLGTLLRWKTRYHTPTTVRVVAGKEEQSRPQGHVTCLPDDASWARAEACRARHQATIDALADGLRDLGSYPKQLAAAGGIKQAPNPLSATVISASDPDDTSTGYFFDNPVPRVARQPITEHTPKMLRGPSSYGGYETTFSQRDHFVCPDDAAWERIQQLRQAVQDAADEWRRLLGELGTYDAALADGRYRKPTTIAHLDMRGPNMTIEPPTSSQQLAVVDAAIAVPMMDAAEAKETIAAMRGDLDQVDTALGSFRQRALDFADREGWRALGYGGALEAINGELGTHYSKSYLSRLLGAARIEKLLELPMGNREAPPERVLREFAQLDTPEQQRQAYAAATASAGGATPTVSQARQAVESIKPTRPNAPAGWVWRDNNSMRRIDDGAIVGPHRNLAETVLAAERLDQERADMGHQLAIGKILSTLDQWAAEMRPARIQEAYGHAREVKGMELRDRLFKQIDAALEATAPKEEPANPTRPSVEMPSIHDTMDALIARQDWAAAQALIERLPSGAVGARTLLSRQLAAGKLRVPQAAQPLRVTMRTTGDRHETDVDDQLAARLLAAGYTWQSATITPDGRWHHLVDVHDPALQRREQRRMRRERLLAIVVAFESRQDAARLAPPASADVSAVLAYQTELERYAASGTDLTTALRGLVGDPELFVRQARMMLESIDHEGCATLAAAIRAIARMVAPDVGLPAPAPSAAGVQAALRRARELAGDDLAALAAALDDAEYEALARLCRVEESEVGV